MCLSLKQVGWGGVGWCVVDGGPENMQYQYQQPKKLCDATTAWANSRGQEELLEGWDHQLLRTKHREDLF